MIKSASQSERKDSRPRFWRVYDALKGRTKYPRNNRYFLYGGRGIKCEWDSFKEFKEDMYVSYMKHVRKFGEKNTQIDRIDPDGNYNKSNCKWSTLIEQANNKRSNRFISYNGESKSLSEWCREFDMPMKLVWGRLKEGWSFAKSITTREKQRNNGKPYEYL